MTTEKISNNELLNGLVPGLQALAAIRTNGKVAYNVARTLKKCDVAISAFNDQKKIILESACEKKEDGTPKIENGEYVFTTPEIKTQVLKDIGTLLNTEIEIDLYQVDSAIIESLDNISGEVILQLGKFVKEEKEEIKAK